MTGHTVIIVEGPDDLHALREILQRQLKLRKSAVPRFGGKSEEYSTPSGRVISIVQASKPNSMKVLAEQLAEAADREVDRIGLSFDPDESSDDECATWIERDALAKVASDSEPGFTRTDTGYLVNDIQCVLLPWDQGDVFNGLSSHRNLERVAIEVIGSAAPDDSALVLDLIERIKKTGRPVGWKTALRLFHAIRKPAVSAFMSRVFGQDKALQDSVEPVIGNVYLTRLRSLAGLEASA